MVMFLLLFGFIGINTSQAIYNGKPYSYEFIEGIDPSALVKIELRNGGYCSGFYTSPNLIQTAGHCLNQWPVRVSGNVILLKHLSANDLGYLITKWPHSYLKIATVHSYPGDYVYLLGFGGGGKLKYGFNYLEDARWGQYLTVSPMKSVFGSLESGDSGGPLVNSFGYVVGVANKGLTNGGLMYSGFISISNGHYSKDDNDNHCHNE